MHGHMNTHQGIHFGIYDAVLTISTTVHAECLLLQSRAVIFVLIVA